MILTERRHGILSLASGVLILMLPCGCAGDGSSLVDGTLDGGGNGGAFPPTLAAIQKNVFSPICSDCHFPNGQGPMPLDSEQASYDNLVNVASIEVELLRVAPGDPDNSYLVLKLLGDPAILGDRMPLGQPPLSQQQIDSIVEWIRRGAPR